MYCVPADFVGHDEAGDSCYFRRSSDIWQGVYKCFAAIVLRYRLDVPIEKVFLRESWNDVCEAYACMALQSSCVEGVRSAGVRERWLLQGGDSPASRPWTTSVVHEADGHVVGLLLISISMLTHDRYFRSLCVV